MSSHKIGDLLAKVKRPGKVPKSEYLEDGEFPVIDQGKLPIAGYTNNPDVVLRSPLPITIFGDHTRAVKFAKIPFACGADGTQLLYPNNDSIDPTFFFYAVKNVDLSNYFYARHFKFLKEQKIELPPIRSQRRIASILSAYDDLIENNRRRIQLLEQAARLLYKEWFVHLRFPGHDDTEIIDGVPEGWERKHLSELVATQYGFTETATDEPIGPKFLRGTDINKTSYIDWSTVPYCPEDKFDFRKYALRIDDIVVIRMADPGKVAIVETEEKAVFASYLVRFTRKTGVAIPALYLFYVLSDNAYQGFISGASGGATRKSASAKLLVDFNILIPPLTLAALFVEQVHPLRQQIQKLLQQNASLRQARDLLLPRLMNGEVAV